jgi:hypothetical protein
MHQINHLAYLTKAIYDKKPEEPLSLIQTPHIQNFCAKIIELTDAFNQNTDQSGLSYESSFTYVFIPKKDEKTGQTNGLIAHIYTGEKILFKTNTDTLFLRFQDGTKTFYEDSNSPVVDLLKEEYTLMEERISLATHSNTFLSIIEDLAMKSFLKNAEEIQALEERVQLNLLISETHHTQKSQKIKP